MKKDEREVLSIFFRYFLILIVGFGNLFLIYKFLTPLTVRAVTFLLSFFSKTSFIGSFIYFKESLIEIVPACVAGSAFFLLFVLLFSTPNIGIKRRIYATVLAFLVLFSLNIVRIVLLVLIIGTIYFESVHWFFWHLLSTVFVVTIWFLVIKIFKIKGIPMYSDIIYLKELIKPKKSKRGKKH